MKTRNAEPPKSGPTKKTPPVKKTTPKSSTPAASTTPKTTPPTTAAPKQSKSNTTPKLQTPKTAPAPKLEPKVEVASASVETAKVTPEVKVVTAAKPVVKKVPGKVVKSKLKAKAVAVKTTPKTPEKSLKKEEPVPVQVVVSNVEEKPVEEVPKKEEVVEDPKKEEPEPVVVNVVEERGGGDVEEELMEEEEKKVEEKKVEDVGVGVGNAEEEVDPMEDEVDPTEDEVEPEENEVNDDVGMGENEDEQAGFVEPEVEECAEDDALEVDEEAGRLEEEHMEMSALAKERRIKKEKEIFVGGLDKDAVEDDIRKVFEKIGEVVDVRLHRNVTTKKNKGYAFVKFANKELATKALDELKNPVIRGKRCGTAPSEDNDTLFVGNICNTWTKEAIKQKLKEYGLEGVEHVTLVADPQHEGLSRGFSFVEFSCHAEAMLAYKRLQKPDAIFGHAERTVKVAFAEPLREPDPEVMAQVKSVFVDGLPPHWDEERVREYFQPYGEIERIVLARNMPTAKRKDFGFVDYTSHEAAIACIDGVNNTELGDDKSKVKVRLANPMPKTQAVKGGLCGGFRIGRPGSGFSRFGRGFGRGGRPFNRPNFQRGRDFNARGRGRAGRRTFAAEEPLENPYSGFRGRRPFSGRGQRGYGVSTQSGTSSRPDVGRSRYVATERGRGRSNQTRRQPFSSEGHYSRHLAARHLVDDPYQYDDSGYTKRPYYMLDHEPEYLEPSRLRRRFDHPDLLVSSRDRYQDSLGAGSNLYSHDYYGPNYGSSSYSSMYGGDRSYGGGYYH